MESVNLFVFVIILLVQTHASNIDIQCIESERNSLIMFKQGFKNPSQRILSTWTLEESCCSWKGVGCDNKTGHVVALDLSKQFSKGELGVSLLGLPYLRRLDLSHIDFLEAEIPEFMSTFKNLEYLNLAKTNFRGTIPQHLGNLSRLQFLDLHGGLLRVDNLQWLRKLVSMKSLDLSGVDMSSAGSWLHDINLLTSLSELRLSACQLSIPPKLRPLHVNFTSLQSLDLSLNHFHAPIPSWLFNTSHNLVYLNLTRSELGGLIPNAFGSMNSLRVLDLSSNFLQGVIPYSFEKKRISMTFLDLSRNSLTGNLPPGLPSKLKHFDCSSNKLEGPITQSIAHLRQLVFLNVASNSFSELITEHFLNFSDLRVLDLSSNSIILNLSQTWVPPFQLDFIGLRSCNLGTHFPPWLQTQKDFSFIDISGAELSYNVPDWFWNLSAKVQHMNLSNNNFRGEVPDVIERLASLTKLDLSRNNFHGPLPKFSSKMRTLSLARNFFNGTISPICESLVMNNSLMYLDLSLNNLSGTLPECWRYGSNLAVLKLAYNAFSGEIPQSIGCLSTLRILYLNANMLSNNLPLSLRNLQGLEILDVGLNMLSGNVPFWLGESLQNLLLLILSDNKFDGNIPLQICQLKYLTLLDLSFNALTGTIPKCVKNLLTMAGVEALPSLVYGHYKEYRQDVMDMLKDRGYDRVSSYFLVGLDVSNNQLSGEIPGEITTLVQLRVLNVAMNNLTGTIPCSIGNLLDLEALDVSRNHLSGFIPSTVEELHFLSFANFSFNNLTGKIPSGAQFSTFSDSSYVGNPNLCGYQIYRKCSGHLHDDIDTRCSTPNRQGELQAVQHDDEDNWLDKSTFYIGIVIGFITGFWLFWVTLLSKTSWNYALMRLLENIANKICAILTPILINKKQRR